MIELASGHDVSYLGILSVHFDSFRSALQGAQKREYLFSNRAPWSSFYKNKKNNLEPQCEPAEQSDAEISHQPCLVSCDFSKFVTLLNSIKH